VPSIGTGSARERDASHLCVVCVRVACESRACRANVACVVRRSRTHPTHPPRTPPGGRTDASALEMGHIVVVGIMRSGS
jgi:hypothetical protein